MPLFPERRVPARRIDVADLLRYDKTALKLPSKDDLDGNSKPSSLPEQKRAAAEPSKALPKGGPGGRPDPQHSLSAAAGTAADAARIPGRVVGAIADKLPKAQLPGIVGALAGYDDLGASSQNAPQMVQQAPKTTPGDLLRGAVDMFAPGDTSDDATPASQAAAIGLGLIPGGKLLGKGAKAAWKGITRMPLVRQVIGNKLDNAIAAKSAAFGSPFDGWLKSRQARAHLDDVMAQEAELTGKQFKNYDEFSQHVAQQIANSSGVGSPPTPAQLRAAQQIVSDVAGKGLGKADLDAAIQRAISDPRNREFTAKLPKPDVFSDISKGAIAKGAAAAGAAGTYYLGAGAFGALKGLMDRPAGLPGEGRNPFAAPPDEFNKRFGDEATQPLPKAAPGAPGAPAENRDQNGRIVLPPDVGVAERRTPDGTPKGIDKFGMPDTKIEVRDADSVSDPGVKRLMQNPREFFHLRSEYRRLRGIVTQLKQRGADIRQNMSPSDYEKWSALDGPEYKTRNGFSVFEGG